MYIVYIVLLFVVGVIIHQQQNVALTKMSTKKINRATQKYTPRKKSDEKKVSTIYRK